MYTRSAISVFTVERQTKNTLKKYLQCVSSALLMQLQVLLLPQQEAVPHQNNFFIVFSVLISHRAEVTSSTDFPKKQVKLLYLRKKTIVRKFVIQHFKPLLSISNYIIFLIRKQKKKGLNFAPSSIVQSFFNARNMFALIFKEHCFSSLLEPNKRKSLAQGNIIMKKFLTKIKRNYF